MPVGNVASGTDPILMENAKHNRDHDGFLKFVYSVPENVHSFFNIASKTNENLAAMLSEVDLTTLEEIPEAYNEVRERGEADVAFKVKAVTGEDVFFGILLEHKSWPDDAVFSQIYRYVFKVMVNKNGDVFPWMSTKAVIIYNGNKEWDPFKRLAERHRAKFHDRILPFECVFVNLAKIDDKNCLEERNAEAGIAALTMKYAFDAEGFEKLLPQIAEMLKKLDKSRAACLVKKIELYLGEFFSQNARETLNMAVKSIGQLYGFVSVNDAIRTERKEMEIEKKAIQVEKESLTAEKKTIQAEKESIQAEKESIQAEKESIQAEKESIQAEKASMHAEKASMLAEKVSMEARIRELEAMLAQKS